MAVKPRGTDIVVRACAKINLALRIVGIRPDGSHELRTLFQSLALHDTLTFRPTAGPFHIECDDPACPADRTNLVWRAADAIWRAGRRGGPPRDVAVRIRKRIPVGSGLGGGSSNAAAAIRGLMRLWRINLSGDRQTAIAAALGADVPYFLEGGTALGLDRGDAVFPLVDLRPMWATLVIPNFGISSKDAYAWWDRSAGKRGRPLLSRASAELFNDLQHPVAAHHPEISAMVRALTHVGADYAAMSGSGSTVFGLFAAKPVADRAGRALSSPTRRTVVTRFVNRAAYGRLTTPR